LAEAIAKTRIAEQNAVELAAARGETPSRYHKYASPFETTEIGSSKRIGSKPNPIPGRRGGSTMGATGKAKAHGLRQGISASTMRNAIRALREKEQLPKRPKRKTERDKSEREDRAVDLVNKLSNRMIDKMSQFADLGFVITMSCKLLMRTSDL